MVSTLTDTLLVVLIVVQTLTLVFSVRTGTRQEVRHSKILGILEYFKGDAIRKEINKSLTR